MSAAAERMSRWWLALCLLCSCAALAASDVDEAREAQQRGAELHLKGDLGGALKEFDRAVRLAPNADLAWYNRGLVHRDLKNCLAAISDFDRALALQPQFFNALYQRGNCLQALGQYKEAVDDYSRAIGFPGHVPTLFLAHLARADAFRRSGRLDEAYADYTKVAQLRSDTRALRSRAWVEYYRGRWRQAHADAARYLQESGGKEADAAYATILGALALRRTGDDAAAAAFMAQWQPRLDDRQWPAPVLAYLRDHDEGALLRAAQSDGERTEGKAYLGADLLARGERGRGVAILKDVVREGEPAYFEYDLAYYELKRLGAVSAQDRRSVRR